MLLSHRSITTLLKKKKVTMRDNFLFWFILLLGLLGKIKCTICSYLFNILINNRNQCNPHFFSNFFFTQNSHITLSSNISEHSTSFQKTSSSSQDLGKLESVFYCPLLEDGESYRPSARLFEQVEEMAALTTIHSASYVSPASQCTT